MATAPTDPPPAPQAPDLPHKPKQPWASDDVVRFILVCTLLATTIILLQRQLKVDDWFIAIVSNAVGFYFGSRSRTQ